MSSVRSAAQLYLPDVEAQHQAGPYQSLIEDAKRRGEEYSKITSDDVEALQAAG